MTTETKRDLQADIALCERASSGYMIHVTPVVDEEGARLIVDVTTEDCDTLTSDDAEFIVGSREGWPEAIRRAIAAEAEAERIRAVLEQFDDRRHAMMPRSQMARISKEALDASPSEYADVSESHRWLKALVSALDDGRIQQTRMSSGTDYVILGAREHVRKLNSEVSADVGL